MPVKGVGVQVPPPTLKNPNGGKGSETDGPGFVITLSSVVEDADARDTLGGEQTG